MNEEIYQELERREEEALQRIIESQRVHQEKAQV
jgi:hypothetical protein